MRVKQGTTTATIKNICEQMEAGMRSMINTSVPFRGMCDLDSRVMLAGATLALEQLPWGRLLRCSHAQSTWPTTPHAPYHGNLC